MINIIPSTISSWALLIAKALESYGCNSQDIFEEAGLDAAKLRDSNARYPAALLTKLWEKAAIETNDPCFGLRAAEYWHPTTMHALGFAWMASSTVKDALNRMVRYVHIVSNGTQCDLVEIEGGYRFVLSSIVKQKVANEAIDAAMAILLLMCRSSYGKDFNPSEVFMTRPAPQNQKKYRQYFQAPIHYSSNENAFVFNKHIMTAILPTANAELAQANEKVITEYLAELDKNDISTRIKRILINQLPSGGMNQNDVASSLHLSLRNMQRKLSGQGTSYKKLLEDTRRELALQYVENSKYSISEITYILGFSEPGNFSRAFKRWTGVSPKLYRTSLH